MQRMKRLSLAFTLGGALALGAFQATGLEAAPRHVPKPHWRVAKRVAVPRCVEVSAPARGCLVRLYGRLPWPLVPRPDAEFADYVEGGGWHRCWWGEWC